MAPPDRPQPRIRRLDDTSLRRFVTQTLDNPRWTQDSPIVPDVWMAFIRAAFASAEARLKGRKAPPTTIDLILTPWTGCTPGELAAELRSRGRERGDAVAEIAPGGSHVAARMDFASLSAVAIPMTGWWLSVRRRNQDVQATVRKLVDDFNDGVATPSLEGPLQGFARYAVLSGYLLRLDATPSVKAFNDLVEVARSLAAVGRIDRITGDGSPIRLFRSVLYLLAAFSGIEGGAIHTQWGDPVAEKPRIYLVNLNRPAHRALVDSRRTVKADAAQRVFDTVAEGIAFAVVDDGIDARHPAFLRRRDPGLPPGLAEEEGPIPVEGLAWSRVRATYDFSLVRPLLSACAMPRASRSSSNAGIATILKSRIQRVAAALEALHASIEMGRDLDWSLVEPLIRIDHGAYVSPPRDHGTHVAGIMAASLPRPLDAGGTLTGMCPGMDLYDFRVFAPDGTCEELSVLYALEFASWLNRDRANPVVHGVNVSLALVHDVDSFACGRTPVCEVCNALVGSGTVVVAAAGNTGFDREDGHRSLESGYRAVSITDPGNAEAVITVGSTHRRDPHAYGVSYFSARGPTGDGRRKPDLLAPGEKIESTVRGGGTLVMDGTSMAAPHVAGAAAMLMSRHPELIGQPRTIKETLMRTAVDLGRDPYFQGAGLVDVLRALQAV